MSKCKRCNTNETGKLIDGVPVCLGCMIQDAAGNGGRVIDYSSFQDKPETVEPYEGYGVMELKNYETPILSEPIETGPVILGRKKTVKEEPATEPVKEKTVKKRR